MRARIKAAAELNQRSVNAEIVACLDLRFPEPGSFEELATELYDLTTSILLAQDQRERENWPSVITKFLKKCESCRVKTA